MTTIKSKFIDSAMATDQEIADKMVANVGMMFMNGNSTATTISAQNTFYKASGTTSANSSNKNFSHTSNKLTYTGTPTKMFIVTVCATLTGTSGESAAIRIAKNGTTIAGTHFATSINGVAMTQGYFQLATNDYIEVFVLNASSTNSITVYNLNVIARSVTYFDVP